MGPLDECSLRLVPVWLSVPTAVRVKTYVQLYALEGLVKGLSAKEKDVLRMASFYLHLGCAKVHSKTSKVFTYSFESAHLMVKHRCLEVS